MKKFVLAITGASGPVFGLRVLRELARSSHVYVIISPASISIIKDETGLDLTGNASVELQRYTGSDNITLLDENDMYAPVSSGSFGTDGMLVVPCSMKTLAGIAHGYASNLIERAADVTIKEGRKLLVSPREMPFSPIHLDNMLTLARVGVTIAPPVPAFYCRPASLDDMIDFVAGKILDCMGVEHSIFRRWKAGQ